MVSALFSALLVQFFFSARVTLDRRESRGLANLLPTFQKSFPFFFKKKQRRRDGRATWAAGGTWTSRADSEPPACTELLKRRRKEKKRRNANLLTAEWTANQLQPFILLALTWLDAS